MTAILFVTQSSARGGVVTMLGHLLANWPATDPRKLVLVHNKAHGGRTLFQSLAGGRVDVREAPIWDHMAALAGAAPWRVLLIKLLNRLAQPWLFVWTVLYFRKLCLELKVGVLFSHNGGYPGGSHNRAAVLGARLAGVTQRVLVVHSLARRPPLWARPAAWLHDRLVFRAATEVIAVSQACADALRAHRFAPRRISVVYSGIPVPSSPADIVRLSSTTVAYLGELSEQKGVPVLLRAIAAVPEPVRLVLYGKGEARCETRLRELARDLGIESRVAFMGYDPEASHKLADAALLVLPSVAHESFGMVLLEAMRQAKPVIASDVGGMKEIVVDGETGYIVPAGNHRALADAITRLLRDGQLAARLGENGYRRLLERFSLEQMMAGYLSMTIPGG